MIKIFHKISKKNKLRVAILAGAALIATGLLAWAIYTGKITPFAATAPISNNATVFYQDSGSTNYSNSSKTVLTTVDQPSPTPTATTTSTPPATPTPTPTPTPSPTSTTQQITISSVRVSAAGTTATIKWTTNYPSTAQIFYGITTINESASLYNGSLSTSHSLTLNLLNRNQWYIYKLVSSAPGYTNAVTFGNFKTKKR